MSEGLPFAPGATVRLKSGGPIMTVEAVHENGRNKGCVECSWHDREVHGGSEWVSSGGYHRWNFSIHSLMAAAVPLPY